MDQASRILTIFCRLLQRQRLRKSYLAEEYHTTLRSIERDLRLIRLVLAELHENVELLFDAEDKTFYLSGTTLDRLSAMNLMTLLKVLLGSRSLRRDEMMELVDTVRSLPTSPHTKELYRAIEAELASYTGPTHDQSILKMQWDLSHCITERKIIRLCYQKNGGDIVERDVCPVHIVFSEFYFYLVAYIEGEDHSYPAYYRLDRIRSFRVRKKKYAPSLSEAFSVRELCRSAPFMYAGEKPEKIRLRCLRPALEAVLDRLPAYEIVEENGEEAVIEANVFGEGLMRWLAMQGDRVEVLAPASLREKLVAYLESALRVYKGSNISSESKKTDEEE